MASKPFHPEEVRRIVQFLQTPAVFLNMTTDWPALHWTVEHLSACLTERLRFRIGKRTEDMAPLFEETECSYIEATIKEFLSWTANEDESLGGPFSDYHCKEFWAYADYKYIVQLFQDKPAMFQVLFVPRHWWLYVESVDPVTVSVNSWIEMDMDDEARVGEALTKTIVCALKSAPSLDNNDHWLNPTEDGVSSHDENMQYLNLAVKACMDKMRDDTDQPRADMGKNDSSGRFKTPGSLTFVVPFGPHLIPVNLAHKPNCTCPKDMPCYRYNDLS
ncbi:HSPB1-associated protein 1 homolog [Carassius auratus]|uniref:HSPB1-associated protein 1 homolog n=1 Tax=Carassius auratus TaxID=7957 RepID=A0A6P6KUE4_CARAU|nr:HSPB1-associated protein 1 homolog [Carassius auratus]